jgi:hypothetical protein
MKPLLVIIMLISLSISCKPTQYGLEDYSGKKLILANGGGFTGQVIEYILLEDGRVFKSNSLNQSTKFHKKLDKNLTQQVFDNLSVMKLSDLSLNDPGNMYFLIKIITPDQEHVIKWNAESAGEEVKRAKLFYQTVIKRLR